ncbi:hypothetical protein ACJX0J_008727, partial [Zea mays]
MPHMPKTQVLMIDCLHVCSTCGHYFHIMDSCTFCYMNVPLSKMAFGKILRRLVGRGYQDFEELYLWKKVPYRLIWKRQSFETLCQVAVIALNCTDAKKERMGGQAWTDELPCLDIINYSLYG